MVESKFQTSFIPKKPIESRPAPRAHQSAGLFRLVSILILIISLAVWGGMYLWKGYLNSQIEEAKKSLAAAEKQFDSKMVTTLSRLDTRLSTSKNILGKHVALSKVFSELQDMTLKSVRYNDFTLSYLGPEKGMTVAMKGQSQSYASVAKQSDIFSANRNFRSPIFAGLNLDTNGSVIFTFNAVLDNRDFIYGPLITTDDATNSTTSIPITPGSYFNNP